MDGQAKACYLAIITGLSLSPSSIILTYFRLKCVSRVYLETKGKQKFFILQDRLFSVRLTF